MTQITPEYIEDLISRAGRDEVFSRAKLLGWEGPAPLYVWQGICLEVMKNKKETNND